MSDAPTEGVPADGTEGVDPDADAPIRVVLADDSYFVREALTRVLKDVAGIDVVAVCGDLVSLQQAIECDRPDVVVTDIRMPPSETDEGIRIAAALHDTHPEIGVVLLSQYLDPQYGLALLESGSDARAYVLKDRVRHRGQLVSAIENVAQGGSMIDAKVVEALVGARRRAEQSPLSELTPRETEILGFVAQGYSNQGIADQLVVTKRAVEKHINAIFVKLDLNEQHNVRRRVKATLIYLADMAAN
jgi:DNA-binding NarL/FixJ family response regulator